MFYIFDFVLVIRHQEAALKYGEVEVVVFSLKFVQNSLGKPWDHIEAKVQ